VSIVTTWNDSLVSSVADSRSCNGFVLNDLNGRDTQCGRT
jgi:hypothetical protein